MIALARDDVTKKKENTNEDYGVLAKTYYIIIIVITIADVA